MARRKEELRALRENHERELAASSDELARSTAELQRLGEECEKILQREKNHSALRILVARSCGDPFWANALVPAERVQHIDITRPCVQEREKVYNRAISLNGRSIPPAGPQDPRWKKFVQEWTEEVETEIRLENEDFESKREMIARQQQKIHEQSEKIQEYVDIQLQRLDFMVKAEMKELNPPPMRKRIF